MFGMVELADMTMPATPVKLTDTGAGTEGVEIAFGCSRPISEASKLAVESIIAKYRDRDGFLVIKTTTETRISVTVYRNRTRTTGETK